jgi:monothiol glutaredoxin
VSLQEQIKEIIETEDVALFMKGTPQFVMCGNSHRALEALRRAGAPVTAVDILPDPRIREELSGVSGWPTIPQLFVDGELVGGSDIVMEMFESGELADLLGVEQPELEESAAPEPEQPVQQRPIGLENRLT